MKFDRRELKAIVALTLPSVITNITTPLLALTDVAIVGHMGSAVYIAAIAVGGTMFNTLYWLFGFIRMGSSGQTAQAHGAADRKQAQRVLDRALLVALLAGLLLILFSPALSDGLLLLIDADEATARFAVDYFRICIYGAPATLGMFALTGWCIGMQNSFLPMCVSLFIDVFNIALSLTLVFGFGMKIEGVAIGTLCAQWAGFVLSLVLVIRRYGWINVRLGELSHGLGRFFRINIDIFLRTLCLVAVTLWFTRCGAEQGPLMLAVNALLMQLFTLFSYFMDGLAFAAEAISGDRLGSGDSQRLRSGVRSIMMLGSILALVFTILYFVGGDWLLSILSSERDVVNRAEEFTVWAVCVPLVSFVAFMWDGIFIGLTRTRMMLLSMAVAMIVFFGLLWWLMPRIGNHGLWIAFLGYLAARGVVLTIAGRHYLWYSAR
ncbi:MAG: MATE family efflux transporter [Bacteroides sp.]|nr:MATE family efflux transporter [Bacteroides sp.]MCM1412882.1 MATE family efflux transporter [Bacteroides sp.]MCM1471551.1 MATE family efflux transporter [Bacteroides sp.]